MANVDEPIVCWEFYLTVISAERLPNVRQVLKTRAYAKIYIGSNEEKTKHQTSPDNNNGLNPAWNHSITYKIAESGVLYYGMAVTIKLYTKRSFGPDRYIGEVQTTMKELFDKRSQDGSGRLSLRIKQGNEETDNGILHLAYSFGRRFLCRKSDFNYEASSGLGALFTVEVATQVASKAMLFAILALS